MTCGCCMNALTVVAHACATAGLFQPTPTRWKRLEPTHSVQQNRVPNTPLRTPFPLFRRKCAPGPENEQNGLSRRVTLTRHTLSMTFAASSSLPRRWERTETRSTRACGSKDTTMSDGPTENFFRTKDFKNRSDVRIRRLGWVSITSVPKHGVSTCSCTPARVKQIQINSRMGTWAQMGIGFRKWFPAGASLGLVMSLSISLFSHLSSHFYLSSFSSLFNSVSLLLFLLLSLTSSLLFLFGRCVVYIEIDTYIDIHTCMHTCTDIFTYTCGYRF